MLFITGTLHGQSINNLESKYGFKQFKFGLAPNMIKDISKQSAKSDQNPSVSEYIYTGSDLNFLYNVRVNGISLTFYKKKLCAIMISLGSADKAYTNEEFERVQYSLEKLFGQEWSSPKNKSQDILNGAIWRSKRVTLEHIKLDLSRGTVDNSNQIVGYVDVYENRIHQQRLNDEF